MADFDIDRQSVIDAATFLQSLLQSELPNLDFTEGSANSDVVVDSHAIIVGWLRQQIQQVKDRNSLRTLRSLPESESVTDAADAILENFFIRRSQGIFARGTITIHFSQRVDSIVGRTIRFFKSSSLVFYIDANNDIPIFANNLTPNVDANGIVTSWSTTLTVVAARVGTDYNIDPGPFVTTDRFSPFLLFVENLSKFTSGRNVQSTTDFINAGETALSLRALINARSNNALLRQIFPDIENVLTVGYGDLEMTRDLVKNVANVATMHVGGHTDIYIRQPIQEFVDRFEINTLQERNDELKVYFRDSAPPTGSFITAGVVVGDILFIGDGIPEAPFQYVITSVQPDVLEISSKVPFSFATDNLSTPTPFSYSVGNNYPLFNNKINVLSTVTANTSSRISYFNSIQLSEPALRIKRVSLLSPPLALNAFLNPITNTVIFTKRSNFPIAGPPATNVELSYFVEIKNPPEALTEKEVSIVTVAWPTLNLTGYVLEVIYDAQASFQAVHDYVTDDFNRPSNANTLPKNFHPCYITCTIPYKLRTAPIDPLVPTVVTFNETTAANDLLDFINAYRSIEPMDVSLLLTTVARSNSAAISAIYPFTVFYELLLSNGKIMFFSSEDTVTVFPDGSSSTAKLLNPTDFNLPSTNYYIALKNYLLSLGISDRTIRYLSNVGDVSFIRRINAL